MTGLQQPSERLFYNQNALKTRYKDNFSGGKFPRFLTKIPARMAAMPRKLEIFAVPGLLL
jgi:hypothetical protein